MLEDVNCNNPIRHKVLTMLLFVSQIKAKIFFLTCLTFLNLTRELAFLLDKVSVPAM